MARRHANYETLSSGRKNRTTNPTRHNKSKRSSTELDAKSVALGRSLVIRLDPDWEAQLEEMNRSKRGRPFTYPDLLMGGIAYLRHMIGKGVRSDGHKECNKIHNSYAHIPGYP